MASDSDRIEKRILLHAPLERVWHAISDAQEFGSWFGARFDGPFVAGQHLTGQIVPTAVDPDVAESQKPHEGSRFEITIDQVEPMRRLAFRWHPYAVDPEVDYSQEPATLVVFELEVAEQGTELTITESGFDRIPLERRAQAFEMNEQGWEAQLMLVEKHLARQA